MVLQVFVAGLVPLSRGDQLNLYASAKRLDYSLLKRLDRVVIGLDQKNLSLCLVNQLNYFLLDLANKRLLGSEVPKLSRKEQRLWKSALQPRDRASVRWLQRVQLQLVHIRELYKVLPDV